MAGLSRKDKNSHGASDVMANMSAQWIDSAAIRLNPNGRSERPFAHVPGLIVTVTCESAGAQTLQDWQSRYSGRGEVVGERPDKSEESDAGDFSTSQGFRPSCNFRVPTDSHATHMIRPVMRTE
ncbi:hypothetical protein ACFQVB_21945 [Paraburkholderia humisilvae]|uniref:hypothetical protein n=1 Tax=Paraburkholderia humisilvae TaxID=627669 RepID=UPI00360BF3CE